eukprot:gene5324-5993_t
MTLFNTAEGVYRSLWSYSSQSHIYATICRCRAVIQPRKHFSLNSIVWNKQKKARKDDVYVLDSDNYGKDSEEKFIDWVKLKIKAGDGGNGLAHLKRGRGFMGPDGGDGGKGGDVIITADRSYRNLKLRKRQFVATSGGKGQVDYCRGKDGQSINIKVPPGTVIRDHDTKTVIADLSLDGSSFVVAKGGYGGLGNTHFKSAINQRTLESTPGIQGDAITIELEMKSIADVGLVGFPNAGKSTLLRALSRAKPAVAAYPFTTLKPNIGVIEYRDFVQIAVADIPGLVEDAHKNKGLGHSFLRHIERCSSLLYVVDLSKGNAIDNYEILKNEVKLYNPKLLSLPSALVANKIDAVEGWNETLREIREALSCPVVGVSGKHLNNIEDLRLLIRGIYERNLKDKLIL